MTGVETFVFVVASACIGGLIGWPTGRYIAVRMHERRLES